MRSTLYVSVALDRVLDSVTAVAGRPAYHRREVDEAAGTVVFARRDDPSDATLTATVTEIEAGCTVEVVGDRPREVLREVLERILKRDREAATTIDPPLATRTRRRPGLAALVLLGAYLVPLAVVEAIGFAGRQGWFGDSTWVAPALAFTLGLGLVVGLTVRFGAWIQAFEFGENYLLTFPPVRGFALGWWRVAVQVGGLIAVVVLAADVDDDATTARISDERTADLPAYADRLEVPPEWEQFRDAELRQSEYDDRPNATVETTYLLLVGTDRDDVEAWLRGPLWTVDTLGELQAITCDVDTSCEAEVVPPAGEPVRYRVEARLGSEVTVVDEDGVTEDVQLLSVEVEYRAP